MEENSDTLAPETVKKLLVHFTVQERHVLRRWRDDIRLVLGNRSASENSVVRHLVDIFADDPKIIKRLIRAHREAE